MLSDDLLALQRADTAIDERTRLRVRMPEREASNAAAAALKAIRQRRDSITKRQADLETAVAANEADAAKLTTHRDRLNAQLKTVIAPREAEALMHEIETLTQRRNELDDVELEHLEEESRLDDELTEVEAGIPALEQSASEAAATLAAAESVIDAEVAALRIERDAAAGVLDASVLDDYESKRAHFGGIAVATLEGKTCTGCHLDLSTGEFDRARRSEPGTPIDCPQCGRLLVP